MQRPDLLEMVEPERLELDAVAASMERTPKLANLLRYLGEAYFAGETSRLTEYNIATEVFGRRKAAFIASEDSIARVQTHRLRKRLKEYYETVGQNHTVKISIPLGTYTPVFTRQSISASSEIEEPVSFELEKTELTTTPPEIAQEPHPAFAGLPEDTSGKEVEPDRGSPRSFFSRPLVWILTGIVGIITLGSGLIYTRSVHGSHNRLQAATSSATVRDPKSARGAAQGLPLIPVATVPLRLIAGYDGPPETDSSGEVWQADRYFHHGWPRREPAAFIARTSDPFIFRYGRMGDCDYDIPLDPGSYELHLYFLQPSETSQSEDAENKSVFNVALNGQIALNGFDVVSDAMGRNVADERVLRDVSPGPDGVLHIHVSTVIGTPSLSAIQILRGAPHKQLPIRIITQPTSFTDRNGRIWAPDNYFFGGRHLSHTLSGTSSPDTDWLSSERYGHFTYAIPVDPRDRYTVVLHFIELFFGSEQSGGGGAGSRVFRVLCNGNTLLDNLDIYKETGLGNPDVKTFHGLKPTAQGKLNLTFEPVVNYATVSAIEIIDESD